MYKKWRMCGKRIENANISLRKQNIFLRCHSLISYDKLRLEHGVWNHVDMGMNPDHSFNI